MSEQSTTRPAVAESVVAESLQLIAAVERRSRLLRGSAGELRRFRLQGNTAVAEGVEAIADLPFRFTLPTSAARDDLPRARADAVVVGRPNHRLRVRAFYDEANVSLTVHGRMSVLRRNRLHAGAAVLERVGPRTALVVPRPLDRGRGLRHVWLVEDLLRGRETTMAEWPSVVGQLMDGLWQIWTVAGLRVQGARRLLADREVVAALAVLDSVPSGGTHEMLRDRIEQLARLSGQLAAGWCHGDPGPTNVMRLTDGRLALLDWEAAGRHRIARDAVKVLRWLEDPPPLADAIGTRVTAATGLSSEDWRNQLIGEALRELGKLQAQQQRAVESGGDGLLWFVEHKRRVMIRLISSLLGVDRSP